MLRIRTALVAMITFITSFNDAIASATAIWQPDRLAIYEDSGFALKDMFPGKSSSNTGADLAKNPGYRDMTRQLSADLDAEKAKDRSLSTSMATAHRLFDARWLSYKNAHFELTAIVNRFDRAIFYNEQNCGEIRFIYRLAYSMTDRGQKIHSRLPFTLNLVYLVPKDESGCKSAAERWAGIAQKTKQDHAAGQSNPLTYFANDATFKSVEVNMQSVRWPSTVRGDLGAHAEYLLRVFSIQNGRAVLTPLENTPHSTAIAKDSKLRTELISWVKDNVQRIDQGTAVLPDKFLAKKATSVSPRGFTRLANRPWKQLFEAKQFADIDFSKLSYLKSPEALLRRLDDQSCIGCHQNRSIAGFHLLGVDRPGTHASNAVAVIGSPHFVEVQPRREQFLAALREGSAPNFFRPLSERASAEPAGLGGHCGLGDEGFKSWTCAKGLTCLAHGLTSDDSTVGQCGSGGLTVAVGDACEVGVMKPDANPHRDRVHKVKKLACANAGVCEANYVGFPEGMCATSCSDKDQDMNCGAIANLHGFNTCLGSGRPFVSCLEQNTRPAGLRACSASKPCRDDYICAGTSSDHATCIPPYFLFQMRVDGHPRPK